LDHLSFATEKMALRYGSHGAPIKIWLVVFCQPSEKYELKWESSPNWGDFFQKNETTT